MSGYGIAGAGGGGGGGGLTDAELRSSPVPISTMVLVGAAPATASVGVASAQILAANAAREGLVLINISPNTISIGFGTPAVLNSGITLSGGGGSWTMTPGTYSTQAINAIASVAASALAIQEFS